jgi:NAD(P)-dependent dehydrogenase (short-subunit alcohol dehydrogenase family)
MPDSASVLVAGGTSGLGLEVARHYAEQGRDVILTGRDADRASACADKVAGRCRGIAMDLSEPDGIGKALAGVGPVDRLVIAAIERDENTARDYSIERATRLATIKLVGYTAVINALAPKMPQDSSIVIFGGLAKNRPYPGSTTVTTVNGAVESMIRTLAVELAPIRVNAVHPGIVVDSPYWVEKTAAIEGVKSRTPGGKTVKMADIVGAVTFLLENEGVNGINLPVDRGWLLT